ncbi:MAG: hypothetical protein WA148_05340, partial [Actinomycetota bacterium]
HKGLFEGIPWGEGNVFEITLKKVRETGLKTLILPEWYDVDTPEDLLYLRTRLAKLKEVPETFIPRRTEILLRELPYF